jgi:hypothetical protein
MNAVIAPKPTLASARPIPGIDTAFTTFRNEGRTRAVGATRCSGETIASVRRGTSIVAMAIDMKPNAP